MSLVAGVISRSTGVPPNPAICDAFYRALSRSPDHRPEQFKDERACLFVLNVGAFGPAGIHQSLVGTIAMVAGQPLLDPPSKGGGRARDLALLHEALDRDDLAPLARTRGLFSLVHYDPQQGRLRLVADRPGLRPLYYWTDGRTLAFSSALRLLESAPGVTLTPDLHAIAEIACIGYSLGNLTQYEQVKTLGAGEVLEYRSDTVSSTCYWTWDSIPISTRPMPEQIEKLYASFTSAIQLRLGGDSPVAALLSGGLDSRCMVAGMVSAGARVFTFNMSLPGTQDQVLGAAFAAAIGTVHREQVLRIDHPDILTIARDAWAETIIAEGLRPERPRLIWTGDDGAVSLGHLWLDNHLVELLRRRETREAVDYYLRKRELGISPRILKPVVARALCNAPGEGLCQELERFASEDPARSLNLLLSTTKMRKAFREHVEVVDLLRLELQMPFMDIDVLTTIAELPFDWCRGHHFYNRWIRSFASPVWSVPWQANPGAEACPLPIPAGLVYQWGPADKFTKRFQRFKKKLLMQDVDKMLRSKRFPTDLMDRGLIRLAAWAYRLGLRDCGSALGNALVFARYATGAGTVNESHQPVGVGEGSPRERTGLADTNRSRT